MPRRTWITLWDALGYLALAWGWGSFRMPS